MRSWHNRSSYEHSRAAGIFRLANVARTTEASFVVRIQDGSAEWVNVQTGELDGKVLEVFGGLPEGDTVAMHGTRKFVGNPSPHLALHGAAAEIREMISAR